MSILRKPLTLKLTLNTIQKTMITEETYLRLRYLFILLLITTSLVAQRNYYPLPAIYHTYPEMIEEVKSICDEYPQMAVWEIIGHSSYSRKPIYAVRVSNFARTDFNNRPSLLIHGSSQGEEVIGVEISLRLLHDVLDSYGNDPLITELLDRFELWFVPTMNPEGHDTVTSGEYFLCRKNKTDTNYNGHLEIDTDGVDLNKNFDFDWIDFSYPHPESIYFKGHCPASEEEVLGMQDFFHRENFTYALNYHSSATGAFSEIIFFPWNDGYEKSPDYANYVELGKAMTKFLPKDYLPGNYTLHMGTTTMIGYLRHYLYAETRTLAYDIETGGNTVEGYSVIRPGPEQLAKILDKHMLAFRGFVAKVLENTVSVRVIDYQRKPQGGAEACWTGYKSHYFKSYAANDAGYLFRYLPEGTAELKINNKYPFYIKADSSDVQVCRIPFDKTTAVNPIGKIKAKLKRYTYCSELSEFNSLAIYPGTAIRINFDSADFGAKSITTDSLTIITPDSRCSLVFRLYNDKEKLINTFNYESDKINERITIPFAMKGMRKAIVEIENLGQNTFSIREERTYFEKNSNPEIRFQYWKTAECDDLAVELR
ncbi:MAG: hypothetical protein JXR56_05660 [Candidatus Cloacimonetes bacterium]|nr:hypothetical protein [Candidatus Cloacimonadota bacterium]